MAGKNMNIVLTALYHRGTVGMFVPVIIRGNREVAAG